MVWKIFLLVAATIFIFSVVTTFICSKKRYRSGKVLKPSTILFIGVIFSSIVLFIPIYLNTFKTTDCGFFETVLISIHNMISLFVVNGEFDNIIVNLSSLSGWVYNGYTILFSILFVLAPLLTFGFVLSFFKNISAYKKLITHFKSEIFIFSELNEKSLALAQSLYNGNKKRFFVFTDVFEKEEEENYEFVESAKELGAICFKKDIVTIDFSFHSKKSSINFFAIGKDESENISQALNIISNKKYNENTNLYVFSNQVESELLLSHAFNEGKASGVKVRRINEVRSLISRTLYENGYQNIFEKAEENIDENGVKRINALIIGMGRHGTEMTKTLSWFCQMDGYEAEINCFDSDINAEQKFISLCPELMDEYHNGVDIDGEAKYKITVNSNINFDTKKFDDLIKALPKTTYVFISLGDDQKNISMAIKLRMLFARDGIFPAIQAVVHNSDKKDALEGIKNFKGQDYNIDFIGSIKSSYSEKVILGLELESLALKRHLKWGDEKDFWQYDYNYKSSTASALHYIMKCKCKISGIEKLPANRSEDELWAIRKLEHCRWNAYMRSEGYVFSNNSKDKTTRNDLAKTHHCLTYFDDLLEEEKIKDDD